MHGNYFSVTACMASITRFAYEGKDVRHFFVTGVSTSRPSLQTGNSQSSLDTSASDCSAFDEEGILFGDSESDCYFH